MSDLINKYRPRTLDELHGQDHIIASLNKFDKNTLPHAFLLHGPSGTGKTTVARIIANILEIKNKSGIIEIDAATYTSINDMRSLQEELKYKLFANNPIKLVILDECHSLSKQAWQSLLKIIEEPPDHVYFCLCTTELNKVPKTIKTRCRDYNFKLLNRADLLNYVAYVCDREGLDVPDFYIDAVVESSGGSPRQALVNISKIMSISDDRLIKSLLAIQNETKEVIDLCRWLANPKIRTLHNSWQNAMELVKAMDCTSTEGIRIVVFNYMSKALLNCKDPANAVHYLFVLEAFSHPYENPNKIGELLLSLGQIILGN